MRSFEQWCWRRILRNPRTAKRSNQSVEAEIGIETWLDGRILGQQPSYFGHIIRANGLEAQVMLGMDNGKFITLSINIINNINGNNINNII